MKAGAALVLVVYVAALVVVVAAARPDSTPTVSTGITRADADGTDAENELLALEAKVDRLRRLAYRRLKVIRTQRAELAGRLTYNPGHWLETAFACIHRFEGSWTDDGAPYWGGLQMDGSFMQTYGGEFWRRLGTANLWPPSVQIAVAIRAWFTRGFHPWPNTARRCGLL